MEPLHCQLEGQGVPRSSFGDAEPGDRWGGHRESVAEGAGRAWGWIPSGKWQNAVKLLISSLSWRGSPEPCISAAGEERCCWGRRRPQARAAGGVDAGRSSSGLCHRLVGRGGRSVPAWPPPAPQGVPRAPSARPLGASLSLQAGFRSPRGEGHDGRPTPNLPWKPRSSPGVGAAPRYPGQVCPLPGLLVKGGGYLFFTRVIILAALESSSSIKQ